MRAKGSKIQLHNHVDGCLGKEGFSPLMGRFGIWRSRPGLGV